MMVDRGQSVTFSHWKTHFHPPELFKLRGIKHHKIGVTWQTAAGLFSSSALKSLFKIPSIDCNYKVLESAMQSRTVTATQREATFVHAPTR